MSLFRTTLNDARSPIVGGLGQIVPTAGPPAEDPNTPFGKNLAFLQATQYMTGTEDISQMVSPPGSSFAIIVGDTTVAAAGDGIQAIPHDGGARLWQWTNGGTSTYYNVSNVTSLRASSDGSHIYAHHRYASSNEGLVKLNASDGSLVYNKQPDGMNSVHRGVGVSPDGAYILTATNDQSGGDLKHLTLYDSAGNILSQKLLNGITGYTVVAVEILANDRWCVTTSVGTNHDRVWFGDLNDIENPTHWIDISADSSITALMNTTAQLWRDPINPDRVWMKPNDNEQPKMYLLDASVTAGGAGMEVLAWNPDADWSLGPSASNRCNAFCVDRAGSVYVALRRTTGAFESNIHRYENDGTFCYSMYDDGQSANLPIGSGALANALTVDNLGRVYCGGTDGKVYVWGQA